MLKQKSIFWALLLLSGFLLAPRHGFSKVVVLDALNVLSAS